MVVPVGKRRSQVNQGSDKYASILNSDIFDKIAISKLPGQMPELESPLNDGVNDEVGQAMSQGGLNPHMNNENPEMDLGLAGQNAKSIAPNGRQPIKAQPTGAITEEDEDISQEPTFWARLAQAISPFLVERNLRIMSSPKISDKQNNVYELLMGPKKDPRTGQPMQLPDANPDQLYADANEIAKSARGRIYGLPFIDDHGIWHIPLQLGGGEGENVQKKVEKGGPPLGEPSKQRQLKQSV